MSRRTRIVRNIAIGLAAFLVVALVTAMIVVQTDWFRGYVKQKIIAAIENGTGGRVEIGSFGFDATHLRAVVTGLVVHGNEPSGADPYLQAKRVEVHLRVLTSLKRVLDITYLGLDTPQANIMVFPDGTTNVPVPKTKSTSNDTPLETVVDLAVGHVDVTNGLLVFNSRRQPLDIRANHLRLQLAYNLLTRGYQGVFSLEPLYVAAGRNTPVNIAITLPVTLWRDRIDFRGAKISTALSDVSIDGSIENLRNPKTSAHLTGHLALADLKNAGGLPLALARGVPAIIDLDANGTVAGNEIQVIGLRLGIGHSEVEASGQLKGVGHGRPLELRAKLALGELGRIAGVAARPEGTLTVNGGVTLDASDNYRFAGNLQTRDLSVQQSQGRLGPIGLSSAVSLDPHRLDLEGLRVQAFGAEIAVNAAVEDFARFKIEGNLRRLDLLAVTRALGRSLPYDGTVSGPISAEGDLKTGIHSLIARTRLTVTPGRRAIPVSGKLDAVYNGGTGNIEARDSVLNLPHTKVSLNGSLGSRLNVAIDSRDLHDLLAALPGSQPSPVALAGGQLTFTGVVTGSLPSPAVSGHLAMSRFQVEGRQFDALALDVNASSARADATGNLARGAMRTQFHAAAGLKDWSPSPAGVLALQASIQNGDLADVMVLAGQPAAGYSGALAASANITGTIGNPSGSANIQVANGTIRDEGFDSIQVQVNMSDQLVTIPSASLSAGAARINLTADYRHSRDSFSTGNLHAQVHSNQVDLAQLRNLRQQLAGGQVQIDADVAASVEPAQVQPTSIAGTVSAKGVRWEGQTYGDLSATASTSGQAVSYTLTSDFAGSNVRINGNTKLTRDYPTTADANIARLPLERVLALAHQDIPAKGTLSGTAHFSGTVARPEGSVNLDLASATVYQEPLDHVRAVIVVAANSVDVQQFEAAAGPSRLELTARYEHRPGNLQAGDLQFRINSSHLDLARIRNVQTIRPGLAGTLQIAANGAGTVNQTGPRLSLRELKADLSATGVAAKGRKFGDAAITAQTTGGRVEFSLNSDLAGAAIHGSGSAQLSGDYPVTARLTADNLAWTRIQALLNPAAGDSAFEALAAGQVDVNGPVLKTSELRGSLQLSRLEFQTRPETGSQAKPMVFRNQGPITASLEKGVARLDGLHLTGPQTDLEATGTYSLQTQIASATVKGSGDLRVLQDFDRDFVSSGSVVLSATVRGALPQPVVNGRLELHNASLNYAEIPNGITNANGVVQFNGNSASVQNMTSEVGGGKVTLGGYATYRGVLRFGLRAAASNVRVRLQQGVSMLADANIQLSGGWQRSQVTGSITVDQINYAPTSDVGSILSRAAPSVQSAGAPSPLLDSMKLDVQVRTSPSLAVQAAMAQNLRLDANLQIRGTAARPGVLGRINITEGQLLFFNSTYTANSGTISFYNPVRIEPILNLSLETQAKGVDVVLKVTGPLDNMNLSYTSNPPLQFQEIVNLLATGKTPTSDPNILVNQPSQPPQTFQQMGETAIVSKALADPVASRLQRVFGVSQLSIDPTFTSGSGMPQAQVTLQQRVSSNMTFTYVTDLNDPNTQIVRVELAMNAHWSAIAGRDENGIVSLRFLYKKQFR